MQGIIYCLDISFSFLRWYVYSADKEAFESLLHQLVGTVFRMTSNLIPIADSNMAHSGDDSDDDEDDDDVVELSPCGRWEKRRQEVTSQNVSFYLVMLARNMLYSCRAVRGF